MPPIVKHDWDSEAAPHVPGSSRSTSRLFDTLRPHEPADDPVRRELPAPRRDGRVPAARRSTGTTASPTTRRRRDLLRGPPGRTTRSSAAVLRPDYPLVVVVHDEAESQVRNPFEQALIEPILRALADPARLRPGRRGRAGGRGPAPGAAGGAAGGVPRAVRDRPGDRAAGAVGDRHGGAVPGRRADGHPGRAPPRATGRTCWRPASSCSTRGG